jgi:D-alanyl-D-alanine carboxypeptidase (penicillin-binding protein 5/6)
VTHSGTRGTAVAAAALSLLIAPLALVGAAVAAASPTAPTAAPGDPLRGTHDVVVDGPAPPKVYARSWIVVDAATGDVLAAKNAHLKLRPASTLKTLTAVTLLPRLDLDDQYRVRWEDAHVTGSAVGIVPGSRYTIDQLFYGLMLPSGNDAARALASANGGLPKTVQQMNETARSLGALDTHAANPTGLDAPRQHSSSFDLAVFARDGLRDKDFRRYVSTTSVAFPAQEPKRDTRRKSYMIYNQNPLLLDGYRGILGVKTGFTTEAGRTYVAAAERGGRALIVAAMGIVEPSDAAATKLFEWGWKHAGSLTPVGSLDAPRRDVSEVDQDPTSHSVTAATPEATATLAGTTTASDQGAQSTGTGPGLLLWVVGGGVLIAAGWWLQSRRRPETSERATAAQDQTR